MELDGSVPTQQTSFVYSAADIEDINHLNLLVEELKAWNSGESTWDNNTSLTTGDDRSASLAAKSPVDDPQALYRGTTMLTQSQLLNVWNCDGNVAEALVGAHPGEAQEARSVLQLKAVVTKYYAEKRGTATTADPNDWRKISNLLGGARRGWNPDVSNMDLPEDTAFMYRDLEIEGFAEKCWIEYLTLWLVEQFGGVDDDLNGVPGTRRWETYAQSCDQANGGGTAGILNAGYRPPDAPVAAGGAWNIMFPLSGPYAGQANSGDDARFTEWAQQGAIGFEAPQPPGGANPAGWRNDPANGYLANPPRAPFGPGTALVIWDSSRKLSETKLRILRGFVNRRTSSQGRRNPAAAPGTPGCRSLHGSVQAQLNWQYVAIMGRGITNTVRDLNRFWTLGEFKSLMNTLMELLPNDAAWGRGFATAIAYIFGSFRIPEGGGTARGTPARAGANAIFASDRSFISAVGECQTNRQFLTVDTRVNLLGGLCVHSQPIMTKRLEEISGVNPGQFNSFIGHKMRSIASIFQGLVRSNISSGDYNPAAANIAGARASQLAPVACGEGLQLKSLRNYTTIGTRLNQRGLTVTNKEGMISGSKLIAWQVCARLPKIPRANMLWDQVNHENVPPVWIRKSLLKHTRKEGSPTCDQTLCTPADIIAASKKLNFVLQNAPTLGATDVKSAGALYTWKASNAPRCSTASNTISGIGGAGWGERVVAAGGAPVNPSFTATLLTLNYVTDDLPDGQGTIVLPYDARTGFLETTLLPTWFGNARELVTYRFNNNTAGRGQLVANLNALSNDAAMGGIALQYIGTDIQSAINPAGAYNFDPDADLYGDDPAPKPESKGEKQDEDKQDSTSDKGKGKDKTITFTEPSTEVEDSPAAVEKKYKEVLKKLRELEDSMTALRGNAKARARDERRKLREEAERLKAMMKMQRKESESSTSSGSGTSSGKKERIKTSTLHWLTKKLASVARMWIQSWTIVAVVGQVAAEQPAPGLGVAERGPWSRGRGGYCPVGYPGDGKSLSVEHGGWEGAGSADYMWYINTSNPVPGFAATSSMDYQVALAGNRQGVVSDEALLGVKAGYDRDSLLAEESIACGWARIAMDEWVQNSKRRVRDSKTEYLARTSGPKGALFSTEGLKALRRVMGDRAFKLAINNLPCLKGAKISMTSENVTMEGKVNVLAPRLMAEAFSAAVKYVEVGQYKDASAILRVHHYMAEWGIGENLSHTTTDGSRAITMALRLRKRIAKELDISEEEWVSTLKQICVASVPRYTIPHLVAVIGAMISGRETYNDLKKQLEVGLLETDTQTFATNEREYSSSVKKLRCWFGEPHRLLEAKDVMKHAYFGELAGRSDYPIDEAKERRERATVRAELLGWDGDIKRWTVANGMKRRMREWDRITSGAAKLTEDDLIQALERIQGRVLFCANGSIGKWAARFDTRLTPEQALRNSKKTDVDDVLRAINEQWLLEVVKMSQATPGTSEATHQTRNEVEIGQSKNPVDWRKMTSQMGGASRGWDANASNTSFSESTAPAQAKLEKLTKTELQRLNKKGVLETLLADVIRRVVELEQPSASATSVTKFEPGKNRLLLSGEIGFYILQNLVFASIETVYDTDARYWKPRSVYDEWLDLAWRQRSSVAGARFRLWIDRCWDYANFNAQHSILQNFLWHVLWYDAVGPELQRAYPSAKVWYEAISYCGLAALRKTLIWQDGKFSVQMSGLNSGERLTTEGNTWSSVSYDGPLYGSIRDFWQANSNTYLSADMVPRPQDARWVGLGDLETDAKMTVMNAQYRLPEQGPSELGSVLSTRKTGDDVRDALTTIVGDPWLSAVIVNRTARWIGLEGAESKVLLGYGWSEWLRVLLDENGVFCGSPIRTLTSSISSSPQNPSWRDIADGPAAMSDLCSLAQRRGAGKAWAEWYQAQVLVFWATPHFLRHGMQVRVQQRAGVEVACELEPPVKRKIVDADRFRIPMSYFAARLEQGGAGQALELGVPQWCSCRSDPMDWARAGQDAGGVMLVGKSYCFRRPCQTGCQQCHVSWALPRAPARPTELEVSRQVMAQHPGAMAADYLSWAKHKVPAMRDISRQQGESVVSSVKRDSAMNNLPPREVARLARLKSNRDCIWAITLHAWQAVCEYGARVHADGRCGWDGAVCKRLAMQPMKRLLALGLKDLAVNTTYNASVDKTLSGIVSDVVPTASWLFGLESAECPVCARATALAEMMTKLEGVLDNVVPRMEHEVRRGVIEPFSLGPFTHAERPLLQPNMSPSFGMLHTNTLKRMDAFNVLWEAALNEAEQATKGSSQHGSGNMVLMALQGLPDGLMADKRLSSAALMLPKLDGGAARVYLDGGITYSLRGGDKLPDVLRSLAGQIAAGALDRVLLASSRDGGVDTAEMSWIKKHLAQRVVNLVSADTRASLCYGG
jgi:hypothetical protein